MCDKNCVLHTEKIKPAHLPKNIKCEDSWLNKEYYTKEDCEMMIKVLDNYAD